MTTVYPGGRPEQPQDKIEKEVAQKTLHKTHGEIGARACQLTNDISLANILQARASGEKLDHGDQAAVAEKAILEFKKLLEKEIITPPATETINSAKREIAINQVVNAYLRNPHFSEGFTLIQRLARAIKPNIENSAVFVSQQSLVEIAGMSFDYQQVTGKFAADIRGLNLMAYFDEELSKQSPLDNPGQFRQKGAKFGFFIFKHSVIYYADQQLNQLMKLQLTVR